RKPMQIKYYITVGCLLVGCALSLAGDDASGKKAKIKWARGIATDFLDCLLDPEYDRAADALLSPELYRRIITDGGVRLVKFGPVNNWRPQEASITSEAIAPDESEVVFKGVLKGEREMWTLKGEEKTLKKEKQKNVFHPSCGQGKKVGQMEYQVLQN